MTRALMLLSVVGACSAWASDPYPGAIQSKYGLASSPPANCGLCHTNAVGGATPWFMGASLKQRGLTGGSNTSKLNETLDVLEAEMVDSDSDGVDDVSELKAGTNPSRADGTGGGAGDGGMGGGTGGGDPTVAPPIQYGFGCSTAPEVVFGAWLLSGLLLPRWRRALRPRSN